MPGRKDSNAPRLAARKAKIAGMIAMQMRQSEILRAVAAEEGISESSVKRTLDVVWEELAWEMRHDKKKFAAQIAAAYNTTYQRALKDKAYGPAVAALKAKAELIGVNAPTEHKHEHSGSIDIDGMTTGDRRAAMDELAVQLGYTPKPLVAVVKPNGTNGSNGTNGHGSNGH